MNMNGQTKKEHSSLGLGGNEKSETNKERNENDSRPKDPERTAEQAASVLRSVGAS
jgi:hypothetical protein